MKTTLKLAKDTKNMNVYKNDEDDAPIPSLYIAKTAFKKEAPRSITVEIKDIG